MQTPIGDTRALFRLGAEALRRGDAHKARDAFEQVLAAGQADAGTCLALADACRGLADHAAALAAVDRALQLEPGNVRALILKADHLAAAGDDRAASAYYLAAVKAAPPSHQLPAERRAEVDRAHAMCAKYAVRFEAILREHLGARGFSERESTARFAQGLDILLGKRQIYFQAPRYFFFPGLPQIQFYDRANFPWLGKLEAATAAIRSEAARILEDRSAFKPYVEGDPQRPRNDESGMLNNPDWSAFYLWKNGEIVPENAARCPQTLAALADVPLARIRNRSPSVLFSLLRPGARIPPHNGLLNTRLIGHLPLIVPGRCTFRVGNEVRDWIEGKAWLFDDTIEHEAWNRTGQTRVILLWEIWRPELTEEERGFVNAMFEAIDAHSGEKPHWEI